MIANHHLLALTGVCVRMVKLTPGYSKLRARDNVRRKGATISMLRDQDESLASLLGPLNQVTPCWRPPGCDGPSLLHHPCIWAAALLLTPDAMNEPAVPRGLPRM